MRALTLPFRALAAALGAAVDGPGLGHGVRLGGLRQLVGRRDGGSQLADDDAGRRVRDPHGRGRSAPAPSSAPSGGDDGVAGAGDVVHLARDGGDVDAPSAV